MKKVISLVLCTLMIASLFAINVNASVPIQKKMTVVNLGTKDGDNAAFPPSAAAALPTTATATTIADGDNQVYEFAFNGTGAYESGNAYIFSQHRDLLSGWWSNNFAMYYDIKPISNTTGFTVSIDEITNILHVFPSVFTEGKWTTVKVLVENKAVSVYVKDQSAPDSAYKKLFLNTDYKLKTDGAVSGTASYFGIDARYMDMTKVDKANFYTAKYYFDNITVERYDGYAAYGKNFVYNDDVEIVIDTEALGFNGYEYKFPTAHDQSASTRSIVFDAVKTGGDRPINVVYAPQSGSGSNKFAFNIWNALQDVKYTYKVDYFQGSLISMSRKAEGSTEWETLTMNEDYSKGSPYGTWQYLKFGYIGELYKDDPDHLLEYCGPNPALNDVNTVWTFSNFQITGHEPAISAIRSETATGHKYTVSAVGQSADFAVMIAVYDGETFAGAGVANFNHEGVAEINVDHSVTEPTFKAFIWNTANESAPMAAPIDITTWTE